jgi:hypothetical protein
MTSAYDRKFSDYNRGYNDDHNHNHNQRYNHGISRLTIHNITTVTTSLVPRLQPAYNSHTNNYNHSSHDYHFRAPSVRVCLTCSSAAATTEPLFPSSLYNSQHMIVTTICHFCSACAARQDMHWPSGRCGGTESWEWQCRSGIMAVEINEDGGSKLEE